MAHMLTRLAAFFSAVPGSVKGLVNAEERVRSLLTALGSGGIAAIVTAVAAMFGVTLPAEVLAVIVPAVTYAIEYFRRRAQSAPAVPAVPFR